MELFFMILEIGSSFFALYHERDQNKYFFAVVAVVNEI